MRLTFVVGWELEGYTVVLLPCRRLKGILTARQTFNSTEGPECENEHLKTRQRQNEVKITWGSPRVIIIA
ncbi:hypothetical protein XELAEV_18002872mg [Xenopus laevis]|nr:hypothetical protein XELAEV_18002872mg [Xenopus laevis]